jgi:hypothetical protein
MRGSQTLQAGLVSILLSCWVSTVSAADATLWPAAEAQAFCAALPTVSDEQLQVVLGEYVDVVRQAAPASVRNLKLLDITSTNTLIQRAVSQGWGVLELVTDKNNLADGSCSMLMTAETLQQLDAAYHLHGLWMLNAPLNGKFLPMGFLVFGAGKLVLGYPTSAVINVADYNFSGGKYAYTPLVIATLHNDAAARGLTDIQVMEEPHGEFSHFKGPRGSSIHSMLLQGEKVGVSYSLFGLGGSEVVPNLKIEKR